MKCPCSNSVSPAAGGLSSRSPIRHTRERRNLPQMRPCCDLPNRNSIGSPPLAAGFSSPSAAAAPARCGSGLAWRFHRRHWPCLHGRMVDLHACHCQAASSSSSKPARAGGKRHLSPATIDPNVPPTPASRGTARAAGTRTRHERAQLQILTLEVVRLQRGANLSSHDCRPRQPPHDSSRGVQNGRSCKP